MDIEYEGRMKSLPEFGASPDWKHSLDDQINSRMIELASYSSWYPQFVFGQPLQAETELTLPQGWISICSGKKLQDRVEQGRAITRWSSPKDTDILILASPHYKEKSVTQSGVKIEIYHTQMPEAFVEREISQIAGVVQLYTDRLGETNIPAGTVKQVYSPKRKGQGKAGIARPGMIVTSEGLTLEELAKDPKFSLFQGIAHEIAHSWWNFGAGQGDWINESFAEYFSAIAVQQFSSNEEFRAVLEDYRKQVRELPADAPPLATIPLSNDDVGFVVRYYKGGLMLDRFREVLGDEKFFQASRDFFQTYKGHSIGTAEFRGFWRGRLGDQGKVVDAWLDSAGGLPESGRNKAPMSQEIQSNTL
jgi:aminopeptidase N